MYRVIYSFTLRVYVLIIRIVSPWNNKATLWLNGRKNLVSTVLEHIKPNDRTIWVHASSLGEFEQGRPLIEKLKENYPNHKILLTFFSPSGYEIRKNYHLVDIVTYLPIDTRKKMGEFINAVNPEIVFTIKYEFWYNMFYILKTKGIPLFLISGIFRDSQYFFKWYGKWFAKNLKSITWFFVQNGESEKLLNKIGCRNVDVVGDTRFDRVVSVAEEDYSNDIVEKWIGKSPVFVAGSTWTADEELLFEIAKCLPDTKWIIAPHLVHDENINRIINLFGNSAPLSKIDHTFNGNTLIIDSIGILNRLYRYAKIAYVGGGFNKGIHNITEAAVYNCPVIFGPNYKKFYEAEALIKLGGGFSVKTAEEFKRVVDSLTTDEESYRNASKAAGDFIKRGTGATAQILQKVKNYCSL